MTLAEREERIMRAEECVRAHGDREALALFRIMRETGIRMNELLDLVPENMNGRELLVVESKYKERDGTAMRMAAVRLFLRKPGRC